jgi:mannose-6-phosphate isomerase
VLGSVPLRRHSTGFPLLTKFIDAREPLSVQVHPNDAQARELEQQENGKTEAWYIIDAEPDAWVIHGLERAVDRGTLESRLRDGTADDLFHRVPVRAGDTIFVPAGTIHAIGPGILLHEAQQTSDVTYRLYDWNRKDHGHKRELHLDKGLQVSAFKPSHVSKVKPIQWTAAQQSLEVLIACSYFTIKKARLHGTYVVDTGRRSFHLVTSLDGRCSLRVNGVSDAIDLSRGHSAVVPASQGRYEIFPDNEATLLVEYVADLEEDLIPELQAAGIAPSTIEDFLRQFAAV